MAQKIVFATMGCSKHEPKLVIERGFKVLNGAYENLTLYPHLPKDEEEFTGVLNAANFDEQNVKTVGVVVRDASTAKLFGVLDETVLYTNGLYKGNAEKLKLSGFGLSNDPSPHGVPIPPVIDRIEKGKFTLSAKIFLTRKKGGETAKKERVNYIVQVAVVGADPLVWTTDLQTTSSRKLVLLNRVKGKELLIRVAKSNSAGQSDWSNNSPFIPQ